MAAVRPLGQWPARFGVEPDDAHFESFKALEIPAERKSEHAVAGEIEGAATLKIISDVATGHLESFSSQGRRSVQQGGPRSCSAVTGSLSEHCSGPDAGASWPESSPSRVGFCSGPISADCAPIAGPIRGWDLELESAAAPMALQQPGLDATVLCLRSTVPSESFWPATLAEQLGPQRLEPAAQRPPLSLHHAATVAAATPAQDAGAVPPPSLLTASSDPLWTADPCWQWLDAQRLPGPEDVPPALPVSPHDSQRQPSPAEARVSPAPAALLEGLSHAEAAAAGGAFIGGGCGEAGGSRVPTERDPPGAPQDVGPSTRAAEAVAADAGDRDTQGNTPAAQGSSGLRQRLRSGGGGSKEGSATASSSGEQRLDLTSRLAAIIARVARIEGEKQPFQDRGAAGERQDGALASEGRPLRLCSTSSCEGSSCEEGRVQPAWSGEGRTTTLAPFLAEGLVEREEQSGRTAEQEQQLHDREAGNGALLPAMLATRNAASGGSYTALSAGGPAAGPASLQGLQHEAQRQPAQRTKAASPDSPAPKQGDWQPLEPVASAEGPPGACSASWALVPLRSAGHGAGQRKRPADAADTEVGPAMLSAPKWARQVGGGALLTRQQLATQLAVPRPPVGAEEGRELALFRSAEDFMREKVLGMARAVQAGNHNKFMAHFNASKALARPNGSAVQRVTHYFASALLRRLNGTAFKFYTSPQRRPKDELLKARLWALQHLPVIQTVSLAAVNSLYEALSGFTHVHIIDLGAHVLVYMPQLLQRLASQPGGPPRVRVTAVDTSMFVSRGVRQIQSLRAAVETFRKLRVLAKRLGMELLLEYVDTGDKGLQHLYQVKRVRSEGLAVISVMDLQFYNDSDGERAPMHAVLQWIANLRPNIFHFSEANVDANDVPFFERVSKVLDFSLVFAKCNDGTVAQENWHLMVLLEEQLLGKFVNSSVGCEGEQRCMRAESMHQWAAKLLKLGFVPSRLSFNALSNLCALASPHGSDLHVDCQDIGSQLIWQGCSFGVFFSSSWHAPSSE